MIKKIKETTVKVKVKIKAEAKTSKPEIKFGLHNLAAPRGANREKRILGRGPSSGHGKTSSRGSKGQTSRSGKSRYAGFEGGQSPFIRRIPKRGFVPILKKEFQLVKLYDLVRIKEQAINLELLEAKGIIKNKNKLVKILSDGEIKNPINVSAHAVSKKALDKIKNAGGKVEILNA
jgi:large subunit ribosomal protein L15